MRYFKTPCIILLGMNYLLLEGKYHFLSIVLFHMYILQAKQILVYQISVSNKSYVSLHVNNSNAENV